MTDTTKPNGDRDRPCDREAAKEPAAGPAMGPPEGTASSGSTSPPLDMALLRKLADEFGVLACHAPTRPTSSGTVSTTRMPTFGWRAATGSII